MGALSELRKKYGLDPYASNREKPAVMFDPKTGRQTVVPRSMPREESERAANDSGPSSASEPKSEEDLIKSRANRRQTSAREKYANRDKELTDAKTAVDTAALDNDKAVLEEALYNLYAAQESSFDRAVAKAESKLEQAKRQNENNKSRAISAAGAKAEQLKQSQDLAQPKQELEAARAAQYYHNQNKTVAAIEEDIKNSPEYFAALNEVQQENDTSGGNIHERGMVQGTYGQRKIDAVTDEQKAVQRVLEQRGDTEKLADYNEYLSQTTNKQLAEEDYEKLQNSGKVAQLLGYLGGGLGGVASWGATGVENIRRALGGEYRPIDTNSEWYSGSRVQAQAEEELLKDIDSPAARWFAQAGLSLADMAVKLPFGPVGMMAAFGAETAGNVAYDSLQRGATPDQAFANGTIAGLAEGLVSAIPVDRLFKVARGGASALLSKQGVKQVLQQAGLEANEELITQYSQTIADIATMGNKSNWALEYQDYIAQGYSDKEAKEMTNFDFFIKEPLLAAAAGGMMGGIMGAGATAKSGGLSKTGKRQTELANLKQLQQILDELKERMTANGSNLLAAAPEHLMLASPYTEENIYFLPEGSLGQRLALPEGERPLAIGRQGEPMLYADKNGEISLDKPWERAAPPTPETNFIADRFGNVQNAAIKGFLPEKTGAENSWESLVNEKLSKAKGEELSRLLQEIEERIALLQIEKNQALAALPQQVPNNAFSEDVRSAIIEERTKYIEQSYAEALERLEKMAAEAEIRQAVYGNEVLANANKSSGQNVPEANNIVRVMSAEAQKAEYDREMAVLYVQWQYELAQIQEMPDGRVKDRRIQELKDWCEQEINKLKNKYHQPLVSITQNGYNVDNGGMNNGEQTANYDRWGMGENQPAGSYRGIYEGLPRMQESSSGITSGGENGFGNSGVSGQFRLTVSPSIDEALTHEKVPVIGLKDYSNNYNSFAAGLQRNIEENPFGAFVSPHKASELAADGTKVFMAPDGYTGFAVFSDGNIGAVFNNENRPGGARKATLREMIPTALYHGGNKLDCFDGALTKMYAQYGFIPVCKIAFDDAQAPANWNYERDGRPDIIFWMHNGDSPETVIDKMGTYPTPDTSNLPHFGTDYDKAYAYRDILQATGFREDSFPSVPSEPTENIPGDTVANNATFNNSLTQAGNKEPVFSMPETKGIEKDLGASEGQEEKAFSQFANENIQKAAENDRVSREIASALAGKTHKISSREKVADKARETINKYGMEAIANYLNKKAIDNKAATDTEIAAGIMAIQEYSRLSRQNSQGSNDEYGAKALDLANVMDSLATTAGRALNMYKIIQKELPGGLLRYANRQLQKEDLPPLEQDEINTFNDLLEMSNRAEELNDLTEQIIKDKKSLLNKDKIRGKAALKAIEAKIAEMFPDMSKEYRGYAAQVLLYKDSSEIGDWMTLLTQKMVADKKPATAVDKYRAYQRINLLLNTKTNLRNIGGNAMQTILETTSDAVGTGIDKLIAGKTGNRTVAMPSAKAAWEGAIKGGSDAISAYRTNTLGIQGDNRYADNQVSPSDVFSNGNILGRIGNRLNKATSFLLTFGDKIFSGSREAVVKQELTQLREQGKLDITDEEIAEIARRQALQVTYQDDTGLSDFIINTRRNISGETKAKRKNSSPNAIRALFAYTTLPFAKTPANVLYRTLEYSAPGLVKSCIDVAKIRKGGWDITPAQQRRLVSAVSRGIVGVGLEGLGAILFANNLLSGSAPDDEAEKKEREMLGITDNSVKVKVGDKYYWVDFSSLGPLPAAMNVGANIYKEITDEFGEDPSVAAAALDVIKTMLAAPINDVTGDSLWEGIIDIADYAHENDVAGLIQEVLGDTAVQMVPLSSFMRAVTTLTDPYVRETSSEGEIGWTGNRIISQIPLLSSTLPIKYDVHGEAKKRAIGDSFADKLYSAFFAVGNASEDKSKDEVVEELLRLYNDSEDSSVLLDKAPYSIKKGGETYPLVGENRSQYQHTMGSLGKGTVNELINSPEFNYATTEQQIDMVAKALGYGKDTAKTDFFDQTGVAYDKDSYKLKYRLDRAKSYGVDPGVAVTVYDRMGKVDGNGPKATILINTAGLTKDQQKKIAHDYFGEKSETFSNNLATAIDNNYAEEFVNAYTRKNSYKYDIEQVSDYLNATGLSYRQKAKIMEMLNWGYGGQRSPKQYTKYLN